MGGGGVLQVAFHAILVKKWTHKKAHQTLLLSTCNNADQTAFALIPACFTLLCVKNTFKTTTFGWLCWPNIFLVTIRIRACMAAGFSHGEGDATPKALSLLLQAWKAVFLRHEKSCNASRQLSAIAEDDNIWCIVEMMAYWGLQTGAIHCTVLERDHLHMWVHAWAETTHWSKTLLEGCSTPVAHFKYVHLSMWYIFDGANAKQAWKITSQRATELK